MSCFEGSGCLAPIALRVFFREAGWVGYPADSGDDRRFELINAILSFEWRF